MERLKLEGRQTNRNPQDFGNINNFRRQNNTPQILQRDQRNREDQKVQTPLQNNLVDDEEGNNEEARSRNSLFRGYNCFPSFNPIFL
jgi:hypothetical protein